MAINLSTDSKDAVNNALVDRVDLGTTNAAGKMRIKSVSAVTLCDIDVALPAFGDSTGGVVTLLGTPRTGIAVATGTAATFEMLNLDDEVIYTGTVGIAGSGADAIIDSTSIDLSDTVQLTSHSVTSP